MALPETFNLFSLMLVRCAGLPGSWLEAFALDFQAAIAGLESAEHERARAGETLRATLDRALTELPAEAPLRTAVYNARKELFQRGQIRPGLAEVLQTSPLAEALTHFRQSAERSEQARQGLYQAYQTALAENYRTLQRAAADPALQRGLLFSSHDLLHRLSAFIQKNAAEFAKKDRQTALSLAAYVTRAAAKTSPLSHFTSVSLWRANRPDNLELSFFDKKIAVVPSAALLPPLYQALLQEPAFYHALIVKLNPGITTAAGPYQWLQTDGAQEAIQNADADPATALTLERLLENDRQLSYSALIDILKEDLDVEDAEIEEFIHQLLKIGLLEWQWPETGLQAGWAGTLQNFLGFLPAEPVIVAAAALLQWLRQTARTLPYLSTEAALESLEQTRQQVLAFFGRFAPATVPEIPSEQLFFEDVEQTMVPEIPRETIEVLAGTLAAQWRSQPIHRVGGAQGAVLAFAHDRLASGMQLPFLDFCRDFFENGDVFQHCVAEVPAYRGKMGALLQFFEENGRWKAVVNALFPGGGKLLARWLHLFPVDAREQLSDWFPADVVQFPAQGWHNASFQPLLAARTLAVPGGRVDRGARSDYRLGALAVENRDGVIVLVDGPGGEQLRLVDLGLEAPETRRPVMQLLAHLGMPYVSLAALLPENTEERSPAPGWTLRPRIEAGDLVLARAVWRVQPAAWADWLAERDEVERLLRVRAALQQTGVPGRFFARFSGEKPQYYDADSPLLMLAFFKNLAGKNGPLLLTEVLPKIGRYAEEIMLEFEV